MRKNWFKLFFACHVLVILSCSSEKKSHKSPTKIHGVWQASPIVIDGKKDDWPSPYPYDNTKAMITYDITNDKDNVYITVLTGDPATELKILRKGIVVWIDKNGTEVQATSICFPVGNEKGPVKKTGQFKKDEPTGQQASTGQGKALMEAVDKSLSTAKEFFIQGFKGCKGKFNTTDGDSCGIKVAVGLDEYDQLVWEAVIPFKTFYNKATIDKRDQGKPLSVCFDLLGLERPAGQGNGNGGGMRPGGMRMGMGGLGMGGMGMGMSMRSPGAGGGHRGGGAGNGNEQLYKSFTFWHKTGIAWQE